jgi:hypothetical protein
VDRFTDWLNSLPLPNWVLIGLGYALAVLLFHIGVWIDGAAPIGEFDFYFVVNGVWAVVGVSFLLVLDQSANIAIKKFAAMVPGRKAELEEIRYRMTTIPAGIAFWLTVVMAAVLGILLATDPTTAYVGLSSPISYVIFYILFVFSYSFAPLMIYQGFRQLGLIIKAYRLVKDINLFHLQPLYAFSGLTMVSSLFWVLILNMNFISNYEAYSGEAASLGDFLLTFGLVTPYVFLAFVTFIVPLWGIHTRIQRRKEEAIEENGLQIEKAHQSLYRLLNKGDYKKTAEMEKSLASLYRMREQIEKVPTWPWNAGTLRGFLSAVFLPLGIWLTQQILSRFL